MNNINFTKVHGMIGKALCGCAGGIIGFLFGGIALTILGVLVGFFAGYMIEKAVLRKIPQKSE